MITCTRCGGIVDANSSVQGFTTCQSCIEFQEWADYCKDKSDPYAEAHEEG